MEHTGVALASGRQRRRTARRQRPDGGVGGRRGAAAPRRLGEEGGGGRGARRRPGGGVGGRRGASAPCRFLEPQFLPLLRLLPADHALTLLRLKPALLRRNRVSHKALAVCLDRLVSSRCPDILSELIADLRDLETAFKVLDEMRE